MLIDWIILLIFEPFIELHKSTMQLVNVYLLTVFANLLLHLLHEFVLFFELLCFEPVVSICWILHLRHIRLVCKRIDKFVALFTCQGNFLCLIHSFHGLSVHFLL